MHFNNKLGKYDRLLNINNRKPNQKLIPKIALKSEKHLQRILNGGLGFKFVQAVTSKYTEI